MLSFGLKRIAGRIFALGSFSWYIAFLIFPAKVRTRVFVMSTHVLNKQIDKTLRD